MPGSAPALLTEEYFRISPPLRHKFLTSYLQESNNNIHAVWDILDIYSTEPEAFVKGAADVIDADPDNLPAHRILAWTSIRQGDFAQAHVHLSSLIDRLPNSKVERRELLRNAFMAPNLLSDRIQEIGEAGLDTDLARISYAYQASRILGSASITANADTLRRRFQAAGEELKTKIESARLEIGSEAKPLADLSALLDGARRIALVGNGPSLRGARRGPEIDRYDLVIRCNFPQIQSFSTDVGSRTDAVIFTEALFRLFDMYLDRDPSYRSAKLISIVNDAATAGLDAAAIIRSTGTDVARIPSLALSLMKEASYWHLTTGAQAYLLLAGLFGKQITIFGFDFYSQKELHYFTQSAGLWLAHEVQYEKFLFRGVVKPVFGAYYR